MKLTPRQHQLLNKERVFNELAKNLPETHHLQARLEAAAKDMRAALAESQIITDIKNGVTYD